MKFVKGLMALIILVVVVVVPPLLLIRIGQLSSIGEVVSGLPGSLLQADNGAVLFVVLTVVGWAAWLGFLGSVLLEMVEVARGRRRPGVLRLSPPRAVAALLLLSVAAMLPTGAHALPVAAEGPAAEPEEFRAGTLMEQAADPADATTEAREATEPAFVYQMQRGDDLWSLAERFYEDGRQWQRIADANPDVVGNPGQIPAGTKLTIPGVPPSHQDDPLVEAYPAAADPVATGADSTGADAVGSGDSAAVEAGEPADPMEEIRAAVEKSETPAEQIGLAVAGVSALSAAALLALVAERRDRQLAGRPLGRRLIHPTRVHQEFEEALAQAQDPVTLRGLDLALRALGRYFRETDDRVPPLGAIVVADHRITLEFSGPIEPVPPGFHADGSTLWLAAGDLEALETRPGLVDEPCPYPAVVTLGETPDGALLLHDLETIRRFGLRGGERAVREVMNSLVLELSCSWWGRGQSVTVVRGDTDFLAALDSPAVHAFEDLEFALRHLERATKSRPPAMAVPDHPRDLRIRPDLTDAWAPQILLVGHDLSGGLRERVERLAETVDLVVVAADSSLPSLRIEPDEGLSRLPNGRELTVQRIPDRTRDSIVGLLDATGSEATEPAPWWAGSGVEPRHAAPDTESNVTPLPARRAINPDLNLALGRQSDPARRAAPATVTRLGRNTTPAESAGRTPSTAQEPAPMDSHEPTTQVGVAAGTAEAGAVHPTIQLLGPVQLIGARGPLPTKAVRQCVEYCAWLLENPGTTSSMMSRSLFVAEGTRRSNMSRLRGWLGSDDEGSLYLPDAYSGRITLHPEVTSDWNHLQVLTVGGVDRSADANLAHALELVRGAPLADTAPGQWQWAEELRTDLSSMVRDIGVVLAGRALAEQDFDRARWAANRALVAAPDDERLLAMRVRTEHAAGNELEVERLAMRMVRHARRLNIDLQDETVTLLQEVMEGRSRARGLTS